MKAQHLVLLAALAFLTANEARCDELFSASGRKLKPSQREYVEDRVKKLRDSDYTVRFNAVKYLIGLDATAVPLLVDQVENGSNPTPVRCSLLALSEIGGSEAVSMLEKVLSGSGFGRDERTIASLGMGKQEGETGLKRLRSLIEPGAERFVRKAAALALARKKDKASAARLIKLAKSEREHELASIFLLSALMIGGEEVVKAVPSLIKSSTTYRRRVLALGIACMGEAALYPQLMKYGRKDKGMQDVLAISLALYRSPEAAAHLRSLTEGKDPLAAVEALYALTSQDEGTALEAFDSALASARFPEVRANALLALIDWDLGARFAARAHRALNDPEPVVRSAAALALLNLENADSPAQLEDALKGEKDPAVIADELTVLGLLSGVQSLDAAEYWAERAGDVELKRTAELVLKVLNRKTDRRLLEERYVERLGTLRAHWHLRLGSAVMREVYRALELDRIVRRTDTEEDTGGNTGSSQGGSSGDDEGDGDPDGGNKDPDVGLGNEPPPDDDDPPPPDDPPEDDTSGKKKGFNFRREVLEWDLKLWFDHYPYFPDSYFLGSR